jgi:hypothetical protein
MVRRDEPAHLDAARPSGKAIAVLIGAGLKPGTTSQAGLRAKNRAPSPVAFGGP